MALTDTAPETDRPSGAAEAPASAPARRATGLDAVLGSADHRIVGRIFVVGALLGLVVGLVVTALVYLDIAGEGVFDAALVNRFAANHALLLFLDVIALFVGIGILVVPRQVGAGTVSFPRAASAAAWTWAVCSIIWFIAVLANGSYGGSSTELVNLGNVAVGGVIVALVLGSVCLVATVLSTRPMGMGLREIPFFSYSMLVASVLWAFTLPAAFAHVVFGHITHANPTTMLEVVYGQGLAWLFNQPATYVIAIPVLGFALDAVVHLTGGTPRFRGVLQGLIGAFGFLSFGAWAQSVDARDTFVWFAFSTLAMVPVLGVLGGIADTGRGGKPKLASPLAFAALGLLVLVLGAVPGELAAIDTIGDGTLIGFDAVAMANGQFYLVFGAAVLGAVGAIFYWGRQSFGAPLPEAAGRGLAPLGMLAAVLFGVPVVLVGLITPDNDVVRVFAGIAAAGALLLALVVVATLGTALGAAGAARRGDELLADPWGDGPTLEWTEELTVVEIESAYPLRADSAEEVGR